jgi:hypothetical protein
MVFRLCKVWGEVVSRARHLRLPAVWSDVRIGRAIADAMDNQ